MSIFCGVPPIEITGCCDDWNAKPVLTSSRDFEELARAMDKFIDELAEWHQGEYTPLKHRKLKIWITDEDYTERPLSECEITVLAPNALDYHPGEKRIIARRHITTLSIEIKNLNREETASLGGIDTAIAEFEGHGYEMAVRINYHQLQENTATLEARFTEQHFANGFMKQIAEAIAN